MKILESIHGAYMKTISTNNAPKAIGPYSQAVHHHHFVFTSGQIPLNPETGELVSGDFKAEVLQVLKILDAGCGGGKFLNFVFNNFDNVKSTGIDFSQRQIAMAQENSVGPIYQCFDFNSFSEGNYDRIFFNETIGYSGDNQYSLLKKYQTMLKPNGILVVSTFCKHKNLHHLNFEKLQSTYERGYRDNFTLRVQITISDWLDYKRLDFNFIKNNFKFKVYDKKIEVQKKWLTKRPDRRYTEFIESELLHSHVIFKIYGPKEKT